MFIVRTQQAKYGIRANSGRCTRSVATATENNSPCELPAFGKRLASVKLRRASEVQVSVWTLVPAKLLVFFVLPHSPNFHACLSLALNMFFRFSQWPSLTKRTWYNMFFFRKRHQYVQRWKASVPWIRYYQSTCQNFGRLHESFASAMAGATLTCLAYTYLWRNMHTCLLDKHDFSRISSSFLFELWKLLIRIKNV